MSIFGDVWNSRQNYTNKIGNNIIEYREKSNENEKEEEEYVQGKADVVGMYNI